MKKLHLHIKNNHADDEFTHVPRTLDLVFGNLGPLLAGKPLVNRVDPGLDY